MTKQELDKINQRFSNLNIIKMRQKYLFLKDNNKFFEKYNDDIYLHIFGLTGIIEWSFKNEEILDFLKQYIESIPK